METNEQVLKKQFKLAYHRYREENDSEILWDFMRTHLQRARESGIVEGENKIVKAMAPYTIQADPKQYCATFTHGQFAGVVREKQRERLEAAQQGKE